MDKEVKLILSVLSWAMLLRNLKQKIVLCNETRRQVKQVGPRTLDRRISGAIMNANDTTYHVSL